MFLGELPVLRLENSVQSASSGNVITSTAGDTQTSSRADQTLTPAFRRWFGASKIVDASGSPRIMYRGDPRDIGPVLRPANGRRGMGLIFVSPSPDFASYYAKGGDGANMTAAYVKAENPFDSSNATHRAAVFNELGETTLSDSSLEQGGWEVLEDPDVVLAAKAAGNVCSALKPVIRPERLLAPG